MPIRFRCPYCTRLLGIARRKAGSEINCPQCGKLLSVPGGNPGTDLDGLDELLGPPPVALVPEPEPGRPAVAADRPATAPGAAGPGVATKPPPRPQPARPPESDPLFEMDDLDAILGIHNSAGALDLDAQEQKKPVSGMDVLSLDDGPKKVVLTPQKATLIIVAIVVLLGVAFAAGYLIRSNL